jgi:hypothetical protein
MEWIVDIIIMKEIIKEIKMNRKWGNETIARLSFIYNNMKNQ